MGKLSVRGEGCENNNNETNNIITHKINDKISM
jgi:hypothetical protein